MQRPSAYYIALLAVVLMVAQPSGTTRAADSGMEEYTVKAALVYNFARFAEWPDDAFDNTDQALKVAVYGDETVNAAFAGIDGKPVANRKIAVVQAEEPEDVAGCHLLFVAKTEREQWPQVLAALAENPVLTVGEMNGFLEAGGIMNLHLVNNKIRFQVNLDHAQSKNLLVSSRLLKLASLVIDSKGDKE